MDPATVTAIISCFIGAGGLGFGIYQHHMRFRVDRREEIRTALVALLQKISSSDLMTIHPTSEHWFYGFHSLDELRTNCAYCNVLISASKHVPRDIQNLILNLQGHVKSVMAYRDSLRDLRSRGNISMRDYGRWNDRSSAETALAEMQKFVHDNLPRLNQYHQSLSR